MNSNPLDPALDFAAFLGLDWGDKSHALALHDPASGQTESSTLAHSAEDLHAWLDQLAARCAGRRSARARSFSVYVRAMNLSPKRESVRSMRRMSIKSLPMPMIIPPSRELRAGVTARFWGRIHLPRLARAFFSGARAAAARERSVSVRFR